MAHTNTESQDVLRRLVNLLIFFDSRSHRGASARSKATGEPPRIPISQIYEKVVGYRPIDKPWLRRLSRTEDDNRPEWSSEVATRLINHDIDTLRELGFPIRDEVTQGKERIVWLEPEETLPAITFSSQEATLLAMLGQRGTNHELSMFVRNGWSKVGADTDFDQYEPAFIYTPSEDVHGIRNLDTINKAIAQRKRLSFDYESMPKAALRKRTLDPWALVTSDDRYYLVGFDVDAQETRCFRCNHIRHPKILDLQQEHQGTAETVEKAFRQSMNRAPQVSVLYRSDYALEAHDTKVDNGHGDGKQWRSAPMNRDLAVRFFAAQAPQVEVLEPQDFREDVIEFLKELPCQ